MPDNSQTKQVPCPFGGWNMRDNEGLMPEEDALEMINAIARDGHVEMRKGYVQLFDTGTQPVNTVFSFNGDFWVNNQTAHAEQLLYICREDNGQVCHVWQCNPSGTVTQVPDIPNYTILGDMWHTVQYKSNVIMSSLTGDDVPLIYDGAELKKINITIQKNELNTLDLYNVMNFCVYRKRLFFIERNTLKLWYMYTKGRIGGDVACLDLSDVATKGGYLAGLTEWSRAGADTTQSRLVVITSEGEVITYTGDDPSTVDDWRLESVNIVPDIIPHSEGRCVASFREDVGILTSSGVFPLNSIVGSNTVDKSQALSDKIRGAFYGFDEASVYDIRPHKGWQCFYDIPHNWLIVNIPIRDGEYEQFVCVFRGSNTTWSRFTGIPAVNFCNLDGNVYFGGFKGGIYRFNYGGKDDTRSIRMFVQQAYNLFGAAELKKVKGITLLLACAYQRNCRVRLWGDFDEQGWSDVRTSGMNGTGNICKWGLRYTNPPIAGSPWNTDYWGTRGILAEMNAQRLITDVDCKEARNISMGIEMEGNEELESDMAWFSTDYRIDFGSR
ncbi:hypothetical protein AGMMS49573_09400 [Endomicrobiia bacterium]|nr:hypothetical protein AGMMS49573_09400 [Endomicrobiia bacterium]